MWWLLFLYKSKRNEVSEYEIFSYIIALANEPWEKFWRGKKSKEIITIRTFHKSSICGRVFERERERERELSFNWNKGEGWYFTQIIARLVLKKKQKTAYYILLVWSISMCQNPRTHQLIQTRKNLKTSPDSTRIIKPKSLMTFQFGSSHPGGFFGQP